ncbi:nicotinate-nicotinamide nucleotide adenylyltransferase (plasmid) [Photobacterium sp. GJ3]|uniref:nicotinate-nicotinamide nucleotide adenylyltransferase n=1 Tax=Photobacterium sp. GJ3 TaxID=2829502 RepID=UPI001B8C2692|nr:nicotinate-nicotinamide nucleotide adenylyltransferase [Photobacterium sp. GJ3]QUJ70573.1 nicotinate-nicotinamide nucleotide adenylyltransferase [Photobacterium sp. GJ3]
MAKKIAVFGSAFNPPSLGHQSILERLSHFDQVLLLPSYAHAWGKNMLDYESRCNMVHAFISDLSLPNLSLSRLEEEIALKDQPVTTYDVLNTLQKIDPEVELTFVIGPDNFLSFSKFYRANEILAKWQVLACPETVPIRSTTIRDNIVKNRPISHLTTPGVVKIIHCERFYAH